MFDLDGTLVETAPEITDAINELFQRLDLPPVSEQSVQKWIGHGERRTLELALGDSEPGRKILARGVDDALLRFFDEAYFAHCGRRSHVYPQVARVLCALGAAGVQRAVISNKEYRLATKVLDAHGLSDDLDLIVGGDSLPARKPDPLPIWHCLGYFGVEHERALMIGDSQTDIATARAAGVAVWAVTCGYNGGKPVAAAQPDRLFDSFAQVAQALAIAPAQPSLVV